MSPKKKRVLVDMSATLIHHGHIRLLKKAKTLGIVIVALTTDEEIQKSKGYVPELKYEERKEILLSIKYVDEVRIFSELNPEKLIMQIRPDVLIKGQDYIEEEIVGAEFVKSYGGSVLRANLLKNKSSTNIINKIKKNKN